MKRINLWKAVFGALGVVVATPWNAGAQDCFFNDSSTCPPEKPICNGFSCVECRQDTDCWPFQVCYNNRCQAFDAPQCGDGVLDPGEQCDDGNRIDSDACVRCAFARCGDGIVSQDEDCDPPGSGLDCSYTCKSTLWRECEQGSSGREQGSCNDDQVCVKIQSPIPYCFHKPACESWETSVFNAACAPSCDLTTSNNTCRELGLACVSHLETGGADTDGICLP
jgi:cysteine-rich repeat protein